MKDKPEIPDDYMEDTYKEKEYRIKLKLDLMDALNDPSKNGTAELSAAILRSRHIEETEEDDD